MYYPDLTLYCYNASDKAPNVLNVGWLDASYPFRRKKASVDLLDLLFEKCLDRVNLTRGWHDCQFCQSSNRGVEVSRHGKKITLGSAEIRVEGKDGRVYAAPNLIYHYVLEHEYDPPHEFVEALFSYF